MSVLSMLLAAFPKAVSGKLMTTKLDLSPTDILQQLQSLADLAIPIEMHQNTGYRLLEWPDLLLPEILEHYRTGNLGRHVLWHSSLASTNSTAKELGHQGVEHGTIVVSEEQTAGRGRRGRSWMSTKGDGIYASLVLRPQIPLSTAPLLTLVAGIALVEALHDCGLDAAWLKWPNDVWVENRKLAGILCELNSELDRLDFVVMGIGVNTHQQYFPPDLAATATSFYRETGYKLSRAELLMQVLQKIELLLPLLTQADQTALLAAWKKHDRLLGQKVYVTAANEKYSGTALGLTPTGALRIALADGTERTLLAGDVSIRPHD